MKIGFAIWMGAWCALLAALSYTVPVALAAPERFGVPVSASFDGSVQGYRLAGVEPDGDPLYQVVLQNRLAASGGLPAVTLIVSSYLENFRPDTTPVLPDLLHPKRTAQNLGGFLQGKVLLTDDAGDVLYLGSFVAEAFLDNSNHTVTQFFGSHTYPGGGALHGTFSIQGKGTLHGKLSGSLALSSGALRQLRQHRGAKIKPIDQIIKVVTVKPHYYGTTGNGTSSAPLHTGFGGGTAPAGNAHSISPWTIAAGAGAIACLLLAGLLFVLDRRRQLATQAG